MEAVFLRAVNMSIAAGWLILAVVAVRLLFQKAPRRMYCLLWVLVAVRLTCPFSFESVLSFIPSGETVSPDIVYSVTPSIDSGVPLINQAVNPVLRESFSPNPAVSVNPLQIWIFIAALIWMIGMAAMVCYAAVSFLRLRKRVCAAVPVGGGVWICDQVDSPFILGVVRPKIYLPSYMENTEEIQTRHVLAHERAHLERRDHWWKPLGFLLLAFYWFHPLVWLAYVLFCRDIELACDERVVRDYGLAEKKGYSEALLSCGASRGRVTACPLAFGEVGVKERIKGVLSYKKPGFWALLAAAIVCAVVAVCFLTDPRGHHDTLRFRSRDMGLSGGGGWFDIKLDRNVKSGVFYAEQWRGGECTKSASVTVDPNVRELFLNCLIVKDEADGLPRGVDIQIGPSDTEDASLLTHFALPEGETCFGWSFTSLEEGEFVQVTPGEERILAVMAIHLKNGGHSYSCQLLEEEPELLETADYLVVVRGYFGDEEIPGQREGVQGGTLNREGVPESGDRFFDNEFRGSEEDLTKTRETAAGPSGEGGKGGEESAGNDVSTIGNGGVSGEKSLPERILTAEDILSLAEKGRSLTWSDFDDFSYTETGSGLYIRVYETDFPHPFSPFTVWVGGGNTGETPMYVYLKAPGEDGDRVDIREESARDFIAAHGDLLLDGAVRKTVLNKNRTADSGSYICAESHVILGTEESDAADTVTVYAMTMYQEYEIGEDGLEDHAGSHMPVALTFSADATGPYTLAASGNQIRRYALREYWEPGEGSYYVSDIREKFPRAIAEDGLDTQKEALALIQDCYRQAVTYGGMDPYPVIDRLFEQIIASPSVSSAPADYEKDHPTEFRELTYYGEYTLRYIFTQFLEGGQTDLKGALMRVMMDRLIGGEAISLDAVSGQEYFDAWLELVRRTDNANGREWMAEHMPAGALCLELAEELGGEM